MIKLDIGSGGKAADWLGEDWLGVDWYVSDADIHALMWDLPFDEGEVDEIFSSHALEHVAKAQVIPTLCEWARVIKPSGKICLHVPDMAWCCRNWLKTQDDGWSMATLFGHQAHEGEFHKTGFTRALMEKYLSEAGLLLLSYDEIESHGQKTMCFECTRAQ